MDIFAIVVGVILAIGYIVYKERRKIEKKHA